MSDNYLVLRIDSRTVPAITRYVAEGAAFWTPYRETAERFSLTAAITEAKRLRSIYSGVYRVVSVNDSTCVYNSVSSLTETER